MHVDAPSSSRLLFQTTVSFKYLFFFFLISQLKYYSARVC